MNSQYSIEGNPDTPLGPILPSGPSFPCSPRHLSFQMVPITRVDAVVRVFHLLLQKRSPFHRIDQVSSIDVVTIVHSLACGGCCWETERACLC